MKRFVGRRSLARLRVRLGWRRSPAYHLVGHAGTGLMPTPIFILGMIQRTGTNYLLNLLVRHPDCLRSRQGGEDFLIHGAHHLVRYVETVAERWNPKWDRAAARSTDLARSLGWAWMTHLCPDFDAIAFVTKTPSVRGIEHVHRFLPQARILVLVRDGRDVVESGVRSFGWTYDEAFHRWSEAAKDLVAFIDQGSNPNVMLVRFEKLIREPNVAIARILEACGLDVRRFDFDAVESMPVYGSSTERGGADEVHWDPIPRPEEFDPIGRWATWDRSLLDRYDSTCGALAERLGYSRATE